MNLRETIEISLEDIANLPQGADKAKCYLIYALNEIESHHKKWHVEMAYQSMNGNLEELMRNIAANSPEVNLTLAQINRSQAPDTKLFSWLTGALLSMEENGLNRLSQAYIIAAYEELGGNFSALQKEFERLTEERLRYSKALKGLDELPKGHYIRGITP